MSAPAIWLFVTVAVLFIGAVVLVVLAARSTFRRSRSLAGELDQLSAETQAALRSAGAGETRLSGREAYDGQ